MRFHDYIKINKLWLISNIVILITINCILISSLSINKSIEDIIYMNVLIIVIEIITIIYGYVSNKGIYNDLFKNVEENKSIYEENYFSRMILKILKEERERFIEKEEDYKKSINDLQECITQWVHDIKVNVAVCDLVIVDNKGNKGNKGNNELSKQIEQIKFKVNQILQVTRATHYSNDVVAEEVNVCHELNLAIKENALFFINKNIEINKNMSPLIVISDKKWIRYMLCQILNNCSKYTPENGSVTIFMEEDDKGNYLHIKDNGMGIPQEDLGRIFDKGFTGKNGRKITKSTGMGLYYSKKMSDNLNIGLRVDSEEGMYTEFIISFYKFSEYREINSALVI